MYFGDHVKILHITPQCPDNNSGGSIGVLQTALSLSHKNNTIDYVGPEFRNREYLELYSKVFELEKEKSILRRFFYLFKGIINSRYSSWLHLEIDYTAYDVIILEFTKQSYILEKIPKEKLFLRVHNVEYDYAKKVYSYKRNIVNYLTYIFSKRSEHQLLKNACKVLALTSNDMNRLIELYGNTISDLNRKIRLLPVCVKGGNQISVFGGNKLKMLITGSLWYGENYKGIKWFITNVLPKLNISYLLTIAGSNPNSELVKLVSNNPNIILISSPSDTKDLFLESELYLAPVFDGAGMKVKIAEALSFGLPVVGTKHAFIGYDVSNNINSYVANSVIEYVRAILDYNGLDNEEKLNFSNNVIKLFKDKYEISQSERIWTTVIKGE